MLIGERNLGQAAVTAILLDRLDAIPMIGLSIPPACNSRRPRTNRSAASLHEAIAEVELAVALGDADGFNSENVFHLQQRYGSSMKQS